MKWYIWAIIGVAIIVILYFGYKMFKKDNDATPESVAPVREGITPRILTNSATQNVDNNNVANLRR